MKYGPNTKLIQTLLAQLGSLSYMEAKTIGEAWAKSSRAQTGVKTRFGDWHVSWAAARRSGLVDQWNAAWGEAMRNASHVIDDHAWEAAQDAVEALVVKHLLSKDQFDALYGPWASIFGEPK